MTGLADLERRTSGELQREARRLRHKIVIGYTNIGIQSALCIAHGVPTFGVSVPFHIPVIIWAGYKVCQLKRDLSRVKKVAERRGISLDKNSFGLAVTVPIAAASNFYGDDVGDLLYDEALQASPAPPNNPDTYHVAQTVRCTFAQLRRCSGWAGNHHRLGKCVQIVSQTWPLKPFLYAMSHVVHVGEFIGAFLRIYLIGGLRQMLVHLQTSTL
jgi:hypothetical protein